MPNNLQPITPDEALNLYLDSRENELAESTLDSHQYRLQFFIEWCQTEGIENLNSLTGRHLQQYINHRRKDGNLNTVSVKTYCDTLKVFIRLLENIGGVEEGLHEKILSPKITKKAARDVKLEAERAQEILYYLSKYQYASLQHVELALLWSTGVRLGTLLSFDLEDYSQQNEWLSATHRPESDTPLKNQHDGERLISLKPEMCTLLNEYIDSIRPEVADSHGREPILATHHGRVSRDKIRMDCYRVTCPRYLAEPCDCNPESNQKCPQSISPHGIRRGAITNMLTKDVPVAVVSDRVNASRDVLEKSYDRRTEEVKVNQRRQYLSNI